MKPPTNNTPPQGYKMTELGVLPEEWEVVRLGEVADIVMGQSPPGSSYNETGVGLPFLQGKAEFGPLHPLHIKYTTTPIKIAPKDSVLLSVRAPVGDVNLANIDYCIGRGLASISLSSGKNIFLFYILTYLKNEIEKEGTGSIFKAINKTKLLNFKIPLPPLPEQQKISAVLSAVQEAKEKTEAVIKATKALKKSMMKHLFTYGPVSPEEVENIQLKETEIGPVPKDWEVVRLGEVLDFKNGINFKADQKGEKGILTIDVLNMYGNGIYVNLNNLYRVDKNIDKNYLLKEGDLLFVRSSLKREGVGWTSLFKPTNEPVTFCGFIIRARIINKDIYPEYITNYLRTEIARDNLISSSGKVAITNINQGMLGEIKIPLPPLPTQQKIASILSAIDAKIEAEENKKQALEELFKSLLHNLMNAKIRVNHLEITS